MRVCRHHCSRLKACDLLDGVEDGVISMPSRCWFDPRTLLGKLFKCEGVDATFTKVATDAVAATWQGYRSSTGEFLWYGYGHDAHMFGAIGPLATQCDGDNCQSLRFSITDTWIRYFVARNEKLDLMTISDEELDDLFIASANEYSSVIGTSDANLSRFRKAGAKLLSWHGLADQLIPANGTIEYADRVLEMDPRAQDYYRLFLAPGADHNATSEMSPENPLKALVNWVERGTEPETLRVSGLGAYGDRLERDICVHPRVQHYVGGDPKVPSSFTCL